MARRPAQRAGETVGEIAGQDNIRLQCQRQLRIGTPPTGNPAPSHSIAAPCGFDGGIDIGTATGRTARGTQIGHAWNGPAPDTALLQFREPLIERFNGGSGLNLAAQHRPQRQKIAADAIEILGPCQFEALIAATLQHDAATPALTGAKYDEGRVEGEQAFGIRPGAGQLPRPVRCSRNRLVHLPGQGLDPRDRLKRQHIGVGTQGGRHDPALRRGRDLGRRA